jgi:alpha-tubulin suppressor-like RCC1 family protein
MTFESLPVFFPDDCQHMLLVTQAMLQTSSALLSHRRFIWTALSLAVSLLCSTGTNGQNVTLPASMGEQFSCFIVQGNVLCSGYDMDGRIGNVDIPADSGHIAVQPIPIFLAGAFHATSMASGTLHSCFIHSAGLQCVGKNNHYVLGTSAGTRSHSVTLGDSSNSAVMVSAGGYHSCAVDKNSMLWCWGRNDMGQLGYKGTGDSSLSPTAVTLVTNVTGVACGWEHTCALLRNGSVFCFGNNVYSQLGIGRTGASNGFDYGPVASTIMKNVTIIKSGHHHTCAIDISESVFCWGLNSAGQLGISSTESKNIPAKVQGVSNASHVSCGPHHNCAITKPRGALFCWGENFDGRIGDGSRSNSIAPVPVSGLSHGVTSVALGRFHTCALVGNQLWCWGYNVHSDFSVLRSVASAGISRTQRAPAVAPSFSAVSANVSLPYSSISVYHSCAILFGRLKCWGYSANGELGFLTSTPSLAAQDVIGLQGDVHVVACGSHYNCAIVGSSKTVFCWGQNHVGQLGNQKITNTQAQPVPVNGSDPRYRLDNARLICAGNAHSCAVIGLSGLYCWGRGHVGQIGDGSKEQRLFPTRVAIPGGFSVAAIACGHDHACAILPGRGLYCWGNNANGRLGDGTTTQRLTPQEVQGVGSVSQVSCGQDHTCALIGSSVYCWGWNGVGLLGIGSTSDTPTPTYVLGSYSKISCGRRHTCAVAVDGDIYCWGLNDFGQLGVATDKHFSTVPLKVGGLGSSGVAAVSLSWRHTMVVMNDGRVMGWGHLHYSTDSGVVVAPPVPVSAYGVTMSSISLSFSNPVASSISSLYLSFDVGFAGARSAISSVVVAGVANIGLLVSAVAQCRNFAAEPVAVVVELSSSALGRSFNFTLPSPMRVVSATDAVVCSVSAVLMPAVSSISAPSFVNVTTFDAIGAIVEAVSLIPHPVVFMGRSSAAVTVTLSSNVALASSVSATISLPAEAARLPVRSISVRGMLFAPLAFGDCTVYQERIASVICNNNGYPTNPGVQVGEPATVSWSCLDDRRTLTITFSSDVVASGSGAVVCTVHDFTNGVAAPAAISAVTVGTYFANGTGNVLVSGGTFPAIFYANASAAIAVSNTACRSEMVLTVSIEPVTTAAAVKIISLEGLPAFASLSASIDVVCTLQQRSVNATGTLGGPNLTVTLLHSTQVVGGALVCSIPLIGLAFETAASQSVTVSNYVANGTPLEIKSGLALPAFLPIVVSSVGSHSAPNTGQTAVAVFGSLYGGSSSQRARLGATSQSPPITLGLISHCSGDSLAGVVCAPRSAMTFDAAPLQLAALQRNEVQVAISSFYSFGNARAMEWISACTAHASALASVVGREVLSVAVRAESCPSCMPLRIVMASGPAASSRASTSFSSGGSVTLQLPTEIGKKALEAADRPERSRQRLGTGRPEVTGRAPLRCHLGQASSCVDGRPFKMHAAMIVPAVFGFLVALAYCPPLKTRNSGVPHRGCDMMKCLRQRKFVVRSLLLMLISILSPVVVSQTPPITEGLIAHYNADSWTGTRWTDLSGVGNHVTEIGGTISVARPAGPPAYIRGATTASMRFPAGILPSAEYTLFFVARYNGAARGRIFQGVNTNWLSGFHGGRAGVAHHGDSCRWITSAIDMHGYEWVIGTDRSSSFRSNGADRTTSTTCAASDRLAINTGSHPSETSDFAVQSVLVYNRTLTDADVTKVEAWLTSLQPVVVVADPYNTAVRAK